MQSGVVLLIGRPNVGKSTLLNNLLQTKVSITSPQPQTTRFPIQGVFEDERGQIIFFDTPGIFGKVPNIVAKKINKATEESLKEEADLLLYIVDRTRGRGDEENKIIGMLRKIEVPKILVMNKIDVRKPNHYAEYEIFSDEFNEKVEISAEKGTNLKHLLNRIFSYLPEREPLINTENLVYPVLNINSRQFLEDIIREKVFLNVRDEVPHAIAVKVDKIEDKEEQKLLVVTGKILTLDDRYKGMIIGKGGQKIKEIGSMVRKELEVMTNKKIYVQLTVETNPHWPEELL